MVGTFPYLTKLEVFARSIAQYKAIYDYEPPSQSYFLHVWKARCSTIKGKTDSRFAQCALCVELDAALKALANRQLDTTGLKKRKTTHISVTLKEWQAYRMRKDYIILHADKYCSIIIDGTYQSAFGVLHSVTKSKDT